MGIVEHAHKQERGSPLIDDIGAAGSELREIRGFAASIEGLILGIGGTIWVGKLSKP
jgi:hypothetical protein